MGRAEQGTVGAGRARERRSVAARSLVALLLGLVLFAMAPARVAQAAPEHDAFVIVDAETGRVLDGERSRTRMHPASLTKMMTLYLAFEALEDGRLQSGQMLRVSRAAAQMPPSELGLREGDRISVRDAIRGAAVKSANDAAVVLAEAVAGTEAAFAERMTAKAHELGMADTTFLNASGLTARGHLSTARDMATLALRLHGDFVDYYWIFSQRSVRIRGRRYNATNTLLGAAPGVDGIKTGYTRRAGHNLAASAERDGVRVFVVLMGAEDRRGRDREVADLIERGFERIALLRRLDDDRDRRRQDELVALLASAPAPRPRPSAAPAAAAAEPVAPPDARVAATAETTAEDAPSDPDRLWGVQVGAFRNAPAAEALLATLAVSAGLPELALARPVVQQAEKGGQALFRARFAGFDRASALAVCETLTAAGTPCAVVPPTGWITLASN